MADSQTDIPSVVGNLGCTNLYRFVQIDQKLDVALARLHEHHAQLLTSQITVAHQAKLLGDISGEIKELKGDLKDIMQKQLREVAVQVAELRTRQTIISGASGGIAGTIAGIVAAILAKAGHP